MGVRSRGAYRRAYPEDRARGHAAGGVGRRGRTASLRQVMIPVAWDGAGQSGGVLRALRLEAAGGFCVLPGEAGPGGAR
jgi:hypothetical protein